VALNDFVSADPAGASVSDYGMTFFGARRGRMLSRSTRLHIRHGIELGLKNYRPIILVINTSHAEVIHSLRTGPRAKPCKIANESKAASRNLIRTACFSSQRRRGEAGNYFSKNIFRNLESNGVGSSFLFMSLSTQKTLRSSRLEPPSSQKGDYGSAVPVASVNHDR
jgi:hypothetical protein